ncbi:MAG: helix-turn-helix domain-containing protein, partial [Bacteroidota bacterium]
MGTAIFTSLSEDDFKRMLKETVKEVLKEGIHQVKDNLPDILNVKEAANFLRLKLNTLYEKTSRKLIPHFKRGNKLYFRKPELESWIKEGKV